MRSPVGAAARDHALEKKARDVAGVRVRHEQQIHDLRLVGGREPETRQQHHRLAALFEEGGRLMHGLEALELLGGVGHEDPPHGTCSKNRMPSLTRNLAPGVSGVSWPSSLMNSRT